VFGYEAAQGAIVGQFSGLMGKQKYRGPTVHDPEREPAELWDVGDGYRGRTLLVTASGAFSEIQSSLNVIWDAKPQEGLSQLVRARIAGPRPGLDPGFLILASLVIRLLFRPAGRNTADTTEISPPNRNRG
jgi:membrane protein